jgi:hypothetical protein
MTDRLYISSDIPICFECHPVPPLHLGWLQDVDLCIASGCHVISEDPIFLDKKEKQSLNPVSVYKY